MAVNQTVTEIKDGTAHVKRWPLTLWAFASHQLKQQQTVNTLTDCLVHITIAQIVLVSKLGV